MRFAKALMAGAVRVKALIAREKRRQTAAHPGKPYAAHFG